MPLNRRALLTLAVCLAPATAFAQSITTTPVAPVPVSNPWLIVALGMMLVGGAWWMLGRRGLAGPGARIAVLAGVITLGAAYVLHAQAALTFTNPDGETMSIPITAEMTEGNVAEWEPVDYTNTSGADLLITGIVAPTFEECVPDGLDGTVVPGSSDPSPHPLCEVNDVLANGATCRVDVETMCRTAAVDGLATVTSIAPSAGPLAGGTPVTITGTNLSSTSMVMFGSAPATDLVIVNGTTVTAVTPPNSAGVVDVFVATMVGGAELTDGYEYAAIGQLAYGGTIASLGGGLNNLILAATDDTATVAWGVPGTEIGLGGQSLVDGAANTAAIVATLGTNDGNPYAAGVCSAHEVDSVGNTPCQLGNTCYDDWFLPALTQLEALYVNRTEIGMSSFIYWSSTEATAEQAKGKFFIFDASGDESKATPMWFRCVRGFTP